MIERLHFYQQFIKRFIVFGAVSLIGLSLIRMVWFLTYNRGDEWQSFSRDILNAFLLGLRFDLSAFCYLNMVPILILSSWLYSGPSHTPVILKKILSHLWSLWLIFAIYIIAVDFVYYSYFQDHINVLIFGFFTDDTRALISTFWNNYPVVWIFAFFALSYYLIFKLLHGWLLSMTSMPEKTHSSLSNFKLSLFLPLLTILSVGLGARGSISLFPLGVMDTAISQNQFINQIPLNGVHALGRAIEVRIENQESKNGNLKAYGYSSNQMLAWSDYSGLPIEKLPKNPFELLDRKTPANNWAKLTKPHVVFVLMESMSNDWISYNSPTLNVLGELERHFKVDYLFHNFIPSSGATIGSLASLMVNLPHRAVSAFLTESQYLQVPFESAPARIYAQQGYETHYVYGGNPGWRDVAKFAKVQGFEHIHGENQVITRLQLDEKKVRHDWGIFDEHLFNYANEILKNAKKPQMLFLLTTTNHPPYTVPPDYSPQPLSIPPELLAQLTGDPRLNKDRLKVYQYANHQLGLFLSRIKQSPLAQRTIIGASGDHAFYILPYSTQELLKKWSVPFYLYLPKEIRSEVDQTVFGSHHDIFPTLFSRSLSEVHYQATGNDLFDPTKEHFGIHASQMAFGKSGAAIILDNKRYSPLAWSVDGLLNPTSPTPKLDRLTEYYRGLMGVSDLYFEKQAELAREK